MSGTRGGRTIAPADSRRPRTFRPRSAHPRHAPPGPRPAFLQWPNIALVLVGGVVGVACREGATRTITQGGDMPVVVPVVNVLAAFLLGYLYQGLTRLAPGEPTTRRLKLTIGTGLCGGLSTYSSLATDTAVLLSDGHPGLALLYSLGTVVLGALATVAGIAAGDRLRSGGQAAS